MHFLRCPACGAKALASASRCPRCTVPFDLAAGQGQRARLVPCRGCRVLLPAEQTTCPWCGVVRRKGSPRSLLLGAAAITLVAVGGWIALRNRQGPGSPPPAPAPAPVAAATSPSPAPGQLPTATPDPATVTAIPPSPAVVPPGVAPDAPMGTTSAGDGWSRASATTWVNVREQARGNARIVGVIRPAQIVELRDGTGVWREMRGDGVRGWVGARHFVAEASGASR